MPVIGTMAGPKTMAGTTTVARLGVAPFLSAAGPLNLPWRYHDDLAALSFIKGTTASFQHCQMQNLIIPFSPQLKVPICIEPFHQPASATAYRQKNQTHSNTAQLLPMFPCTGPGAHNMAGVSQPCC